MVALCHRHVRAIRKGVEQFADGDDDGAYGVAIALRVLLHYGGQGKPLLHSLGVIKSMTYTDGAEYRPPMAGLVLPSITLNTDGSLRDFTLVPNGAQHPDPDFRNPPREYTAWWKNDEPINSSNGRPLSREFLVTNMANQDGAHADVHVNVVYDQLKSDFMGFQFHGNVQIGSALATASVVQVGVELAHTLLRCAPNLLPSPWEPGRYFPALTT